MFLPFYKLLQLIFIFYLMQEGMKKLGLIKSK